MNHDGENSLPSRLPPQNLEAERALLGACLLCNEVIDEVAELIEPGDFYREVHGLIWGHVQRIRESGRPVDFITVEDALVGCRESRRHGLHDRSEAREYLGSIEHDTPSAANARYYA